MKKHVKEIPFIMVLALALFLFMLPIYLMVNISLKNMTQIFSVPPFSAWQITYANYAYILGWTDFPKYFVNSVIISGCSTLMALALGVPAAYSFARFKFRRSEDLSFFILSTRMAPPIGVVIPLFLVYQEVGLYDTYLGLILVYVTLGLALVVWLMKGFFRNIPVELYEAAVIDGCSRLDAFLRIDLPLCAPGLVATAILSIMFNWNEFLMALVLTGYERKPLPVVMYGFVTTLSVDWGRLCATAVIVVLPIIFFALIVQKYIVAGLTLGAVKG
jgi:multiple sugar transport system permease protein